MKVKELIKELKQLNQDAKVFITVGDYDINIIDTTKFKLIDKDCNEYVSLFIYLKEVKEDIKLNTFID